MQVGVLIGGLSTHATLNLGWNSVVLSTVAAAAATTAGCDTHCGGTGNGLWLPGGRSGSKVSKSSMMTADFETSGWTDSKSWAVVVETRQVDKQKTVGSLLEICSSRTEMGEQGTWLVKIMMRESVRSSVDWR
ncbi:hypothetical protein LY78DRAFT_187447 [Colletotrichum sublineola]|nr:hypothetical protein LY78DRAFT_187447 [Colletotrichum sublineola]